MKFFRGLVLFALLFITQSALGQFYQVGDDPGNLKWYDISTEHYQIIYPEGLDSLAREFGIKLEKYRIPVSKTAGYIPGEMIKKKMPVVLHAHNAYSNGSVAWAPKRMDLYTLPPAYEPDALPWIDMLAIHESRHVAQMQFGLTKALKPFNWFFGEMFNGATAGFYPHKDMLEGDAVIAETALSLQGRGRRADFLNYYKMAFDNGDMRNWQRWFYGSAKYYYPDHYALGYMVYGGSRYVYGNSHLVSDYFHYAARRPYNLLPRNHVFKKVYGQKFRKTFAVVTDSLHNIWTEEINSRAPFTPSEQVTKSGRHTEYTNNIVIGNDLYSLKEGLLHNKTLVRIDENGKEHFIKRFGSEVGMLYYSSVQNRIFWSETLPDERWTMKYDSGVRYMDLDKKRKKTLSRKSQLFNPNPSPTDGHIATAEYHIDGGTSLSIINRAGGTTEVSFPAPDTLQLVETAWLDDYIFATAVSQYGYGIYRLDIDDLTFHDSEHPDRHTQFIKRYRKYDWETVLAPQPVTIKNFGTRGNELMFTCDRTGTDELYHFNPEDGELTQQTSTKYGASEFQYSADGKTLYYSALCKDGMMIFKTPADSLMDKVVSFSDRHKYKIADKLTEQELALYDNSSWNDSSVTFSAPKRFRKFPDLFNLHSWAPAYIDVDNIMNMSFDHIYEAASLGAVALMQNKLGTSATQLGYSAHKDPYNPAKWKHSGHLKFTYSGLYPVFELRVDFNDRDAREYRLSMYNDAYAGYRSYMTAGSYSTSSPYIKAELSAYIPFNFSSGGWLKGFIPKITYRISNDVYNSSVVVMEKTKEEEDYHLKHTLPGYKGIIQDLTTSLRAYAVTYTPTSGVYPRFGIGAEIGHTFKPGLTQWFKPMAYAYLYAYLPGFVRSHGIKLTAISQIQLPLFTETLFVNPIVNVLPRGFANNPSLNTFLSGWNGITGKLTADYALPVCFGDINLFNGLFYITRFVLTPHFDCTAISDNILFSAGASLTLDLKSIFGFHLPVSAGITYSYNGGQQAFEHLQEVSGIPMGHHFVGPVVSIDF